MLRHDILLAVRPVYVSYIQAGKKRVELRKKILLNHINKIYIYATRPVQKIVGFFVPQRIAIYPPDVLWEMTKPHSCVTKKDFFTYFQGKKEGIGIFFNHFSPIAPTSLNEISAPIPQNYVKLLQEQSQALAKKSLISAPGVVF